MTQGQWFAGLLFGAIFLAVVIYFLVKSQEAANERLDRITGFVTLLASSLPF